MERGDLIAMLEASAGPGEGKSPGVRIGVLADFQGGRPRVDFPGNTEGPLPARSMVPLEVPAGVGASCREVVLLFDGGDPRRPIIAGFLEPSGATPALDAALDATLARSTSVENPDSTAVAEVDGQRLVIEAKDEVVIRCGESSITLRRNGKVVIRGLYVETHAAGTNRIKGGSVKIN